LKWYLTGTEANDRADLAKIDIMLSHTGKEARDVYKMFEWRVDGNQNN